MCECSRVIQRVREVCEKRMKSLILFILLHLALVACSGSGIALPSGTYVASATKETITIDEAKIHFKVFVDDGHTQLIDRSCEFSVWPDGRIQPHPLASQEVLTGIGKFYWRWDGQAIVQSDPRAPARPARIFKLQEEAGP